MGIKNDCRRNAEGYSDPTAYEALKNIEQEDERFHKLLDTIFTSRSESSSKTNEPEKFRGNL